MTGYDKALYTLWVAPQDKAIDYEHTVHIYRANINNSEERFISYQLEIN